MERLLFCPVALCRNTSEICVFHIQNIDTEREGWTYVQGPKGGKFSQNMDHLSIFFSFFVFTNVFEAVQINILYLKWIIYLNVISARCHL